MDESRLDRASSVSRRWFLGAVAAGGLAYGQSGTGVRPGRHEFKVKAQGHEWTCHAHVPGRLPESGEFPLVLVLHGSGASGPEYLDRARWAPEAERRRFIALAPDALRIRPRGLPQNATNPRRWNSGQLGDGTERSRIDDSRFLVGLIDVVAERWPVDRDRVYVVGHSNGGSMAFLVVNQFSDRFTAMASVGGHCWVTEPTLDVPLPTIFMVGEHDPLMPLKGGTSVLPWEIRQTPPFRWTTDRWAKAMGCPTKPEIERVAGARVLRFGSESNEAELRGIIVDGQGHHWPGAPDMVVERVFLGPNRSKLDATGLIASFFEGYRRG